MSWDLEVFAPDRPEPGERAEELDAHGVSVDGPLEVEDEDLPEVVAGALLVCRWTVQISVPAGATKGDVRRAERLARALAKESSGLVYDPQEDAIVWPRSVKRLREPVVSRDRDDDGRTLELTWLVARRLDARDGHALVDILQRDLPEALPRRFGGYEPPQGRLERDGAPAFAALWDEDSGPFWY